MEKKLGDIITPMAIKGIAGIVGTYLMVEMLLTGVSAYNVFLKKDPPWYSRDLIEYYEKIQQSVSPLERTGLKLLFDIPSVPQRVNAERGKNFY